MCVRKHIRELKGLQYAAPTSPQLGSSRHSEHTYTVLLSHNLHLDCRNFFGPDPPSSKTRFVGVMWRPRPADPVVLANDAASTLTLDAVDGLVVTPNANLFSTNSRISPRVNSCWVILAPVHIECNRNASIIIIPSMLSRYELPLSPTNGKPHGKPAQFFHNLVARQQHLGVCDNTDKTGV